MKNRSSREIKKYAAITAELIKHHYGKTPEKVLPLTGGLTHFVYEVHISGEELVVKLSADTGKMNCFLKEQWALAKAREKSIPVPEILEVGQNETAGVYMIARKTEGKEATHHEDRLKIIEEMGEYAARIHSISTSNYGEVFDWSQNTLSKNTTWKDYLHNEFNVHERLNVLVKNKMLGIPQISKIKTQIKKMELLVGKPCLHHGDMRLKNLIIGSKGTIVAIIDWDNCISSIAPYWDMSIALHDLSIDEKLSFLKGYGVSQNIFNKIAPVIKTFNLLNYGPVIERLAARKDNEKLDHYRTRLRGALDMFSL